MAHSPFRMRSGHDMPRTALGTWRSNDEQLRVALKAALDCGVRHIDTAHLYFNEPLIGEVLSEAIATGAVKREDLFVTSKLMPSDMHPDTARAALELTLRNLRLDYVDLYLLHWPYAVVNKPSKFPVPAAERLGYLPEHVDAVWRVLEQAVEDGLVRSLGVSNYSPKKIERLESAGLVHPVCCNQLELHPALPMTAWVRWCLDRGIAVTAFMPLGSPSRPPTCRHAGDPDLLGSAVVSGIAAAHPSATPAQVLLRWALDRGTIPLPKSVTPARIVENAAALLAPWELTADDRAALGRLDVGHRFMRGDHVAVANAHHGAHWRAVWDEEPQPGDE